MIGSSSVAEHFFHIQIAAAAGDDADVVVIGHLHTVIHAVFRQRLQLLRPLLHDGMAQLGVAGHHDVLGGLLDVVLHRDGFPFPDVHHALAVGDARAHPQQHRRVIFFAQLERALREGVGFRAVGGLQHGHLCRNGVMPAVLLVLAGVHRGVVRHADHHAAGDARIAQREQRIRRHVQAHVLHRADAAHPGQARAEGRLHGDLLVRRPLAVDVVILCQELRDLRGGRSRITAYQPDASVVKAPRHRFIANQ